MTGHLGKFFFVLGWLLLFSALGFANNLSVTNVTLGTRDPNAKTVAVTFNVSWQNSWRNKINYDAAWLTVRLNNTQVTPTDKILCQITATGLNPAGSSPEMALICKFMCLMMQPALFCNLPAPVLWVI